VCGGDPRPVGALAAGVLAGVVSVVASLASLVSYPALLAVGLPPLTANVTNTVALSCNAIGAAAGSQPELRGQRSRVLRLGAVCVLGGAVGALLLLVTPAEAFQRIVPWLIGLASLLLLARPLVQRERGPRGGDRHPLVVAGMFLAAVYAGYFGAAAGVLMLALLSAVTTDSHARVNALKNVVLGLGNATAALGFAVLGPVSWTAAVPLAVGFFGGGLLGPRIVRRLPGAALRVAIGLLGIALAVRLGYDAYR
jgi:uncharacterized membrane protein YfcA